MYAYIHVVFTLNKNTISSTFLHVGHAYRDSYLGDRNAFCLQNQPPISILSQHPNLIMLNQCVHNILCQVDLSTFMAELKLTGPLC